MAEEKAKILDLDSFVPEDKEVIIGKKKYLIRGDATVKMTIKLMKNVDLWQKKPESDEAMDALVETIMAFFKTPIEKEVLLGLGNKQLPRLLAFIYNKELPESKEGTEEKNAQSQPDQK